MYFGLIACEDEGPCVHGAGGGEGLQMAENVLTKQSWTAVRVNQIWCVAERKQILTAIKHGAT